MEATRKGRQRSIDTSMGALAEAENRAFYEEEDNVLNDLNELLDAFLRKNEEPEHRQLLKEYDSGLSFTGPEGTRKKLGVIDMEFLGRAHFPHYFSRPSPDFHRDLNVIWQDGVLKGCFPITRKAAREISRLEGCCGAVAAPRGYVKSTTLTLRGSMHAILCQYKHYSITLSDSSDQAEGPLEDIRVELEKNGLIRENFGSLQRKVWHSNVILAITNVKVGAIGSGKKM